MKSWGQLKQCLSSFEAWATSNLCTRWPQCPLLAPLSMRVPFVPWGPSQGQHFTG